MCVWGKIHRIELCLVYKYDRHMHACIQQVPGLPGLDAGEEVGQLKGNVKTGADGGGIFYGGRVFLEGGASDRAAHGDGAGHDDVRRQLRRLHPVIIVQQALHNLIKGRTTFVIAHRLSTIRHADRIVVIKAGRIVEEGQHEALLAQEGEYHRFYQLQSQEGRV